MSTTENRVAVIGIIVEDESSVESLNKILHDYAPYIIGRMGVPHREQNINVISVAVEAPLNAISAMTGKIGGLAGVSCKAAYSNYQPKDKGALHD